MKKVTAIIILLFAFFVLAACGSGTNEFSPPGVDENEKSGQTSEPEEETVKENEEEMESTVKENPPARILDQNKPAIALTFDDGPNTTNSVKILDALEERGLVATYFIIGGNINEQTAEVMKRAYALGCEYGNHSWGWDSMGKWESERIIESIQKTAEKIVEVLGKDAYPKFFRAPNLNTGTEMIETVKELGYPLMNGIIGNDWESGATPESIYNLIVPKVTDGIIILLHDGVSNNVTAEGIGAILDALIDEGYQFVTLSELFELKGVEIEAGKTYNQIK
ncbi:MAG: polysaccharide deacetylase family protein [Oscillospiraceae bacterium]|nr:polysaccharide deacetylase family protein [Oscillospiraceae bacterium]